MAHPPSVLSPGRLGAGFFADPAFMTQLDVTFANLYFTAVDDAGNPPAVPLAWRPLIEQRAQRGIEPVQFALAGMSAHINHDLPLAVTGTCAALATSPSAGAHQADYQKVDQLLDAAEQSVRQSCSATAWPLPPLRPAACCSSPSDFRQETWASRTARTSGCITPPRLPHTRTAPCRASSYPTSSATWISLSSASSSGPITAT
jgi:Family of unknown function (DUF5995)